jgi:uncharacterized protein (DUF2235 family)
MEESRPEAFQPAAPPSWGYERTSRDGPKRIFVLLDGAGDELQNGMSGVESGGNSNVLKLYTALLHDGEQMAYYHPTVGTRADPSEENWLKTLQARIKALAFGAGFKEDVLDAYRYLMQHYNAGDTVYILGFSRGAYVARALAGFLHAYGLILRGNEGRILPAWASYLKKLRFVSNIRRGTVDTDTSFRDTFSHPDFMIHFVGLWDTVSDLGWIMTPPRLLRMAQNPSVLIGRHALSVHERRCFYSDNLWGSPIQVQVPAILLGTPRGNAIPPLQDIKQVWFPGVHSDVGGGYEQSTSGLSNIALKWMMDEVEKAGGRFEIARKQAVLGIRPVTDDPHHMTDSLQALCAPPRASVVHRSLRGYWWLLETFPHRYFDTYRNKETVRIPFGAWREIPNGALMHSELLKEIIPGTFLYDPPNLKGGTRALIGKGTDAEYAEFRSPAPRRDWRQNLLVVFLVETIWTAFALALLRRLLSATMFPLLLGFVKIFLPEQLALPEKIMEFAYDQKLIPVYLLNYFQMIPKLFHEAQHGSSQAGLLWSLAMAPVLVGFYTILRLIVRR